MCSVYISLYYSRRSLTLIEKSMKINCYIKFLSLLLASVQAKEMPLPTADANQLVENVGVLSEKRIEKKIEGHQTGRSQSNPIDSFYPRSHSNFDRRAMSLDSHHSLDHGHSKYNRHEGHQPSSSTCILCHVLGVQEKYKNDSKKSVNPAKEVAVLREKLKDPTLNNIEKISIVLKLGKIQAGLENAEHLDKIENAEIKYSDEQKKKKDNIPGHDDDHRKGNVGALHPENQHSGTNDSIPQAHLNEKHDEKSHNLDFKSQPQSGSDIHNDNDQHHLQEIQNNSQSPAVSSNNKSPSEGHNEFHQANKGKDQQGSNNILKSPKPSPHDQQEALPFSAAHMNNWVTRRNVITSCHSSPLFVSHGSKKHEKHTELKQKIHCDHQIDQSLILNSDNHKMAVLPVKNESHTTNMVSSNHESHQTSPHINGNSMKNNVPTVQPHQNTDPKNTTHMKNNSGGDSKLEQLHTNELQNTVESDDHPTLHPQQHKVELNRTLMSKNSHDGQSHSPGDQAIQRMVHSDDHSSEAHTSKVNDNSEISHHQEMHEEPCFKGRMKDLLERIEETYRKWASEHRIVSNPRHSSNKV